MGDVQRRSFYTHLTEIVGVPAESREPWLSGDYKANVWATPSSLRAGAELGRGDSASSGVDADGRDGAGSRERKVGGAHAGDRESPYDAERVLSAQSEGRGPPSKGQTKGKESRPHATAESTRPTAAPVKYRNRRRDRRRCMTRERERPHDANMDAKGKRTCPR